MKIFLKYNKGFKWYKSNTIYFKGYFYIDNSFYEKENALKYLSKIDKLTTILQEISGCFTILKKEKESLFIISDITRSFPIFYTIQNDEFYVSDNIYYLKSICNINDFDTYSELEFKASNHTYGNKTLLKEVYQIQAGEYLEIRNNKIENSSFRYSYAIQKESNSHYKTLKKQAVTAFEKSFKRLLISLDKKTVIIPLSSGFDSRLIAVMLKKNNYKNVICYTYGKKDSFEINTSKKVAKALGYKWYFIEYNNNLIDGYLESKLFENYVKYAGKLSSMPNLQEYFAVKYLKENKLIPEDSIFIPGYAGDILGGSEYSKSIPENIKHSNLAQNIFEKKMNNYHFKNKEEIYIINKLKKEMYKFDKLYNEKIPETILDDFNIRERIAKYIFNSANFYSYFEYEFRFPFWDKELLDFFKEVPIKFKKNKLLFNDVLIHQYFKPNHVYFESKTEVKAEKKYIRKIKNQIKPFLPTFIKEKKVSGNDWNNYKIITDKMLIFLKNKGIKVNRNYNDYNEIITQWYVYISKNRSD